MNQETKLVFAVEHVAHLEDLIEGNAWEDYLKGLEFNDRSNRKDDLDKAQYFFDKAFQNDSKFAVPETKQLLKFKN